MKFSVSYCKTILSICALLSFINSWGWGQKGHDVTCAIAEHHLTEKTRAAVLDLLEGKSLVYWSNWLDNASHTPEYGYSRTWHYKNIDDGQEYEEAPINPTGDVVVAIRDQVKTLGKSYKKKNDKQILALKMLIHLVGDLHQPMHLGRLSDKGGNYHKITFFTTETNLHSLWDSYLPESAHKWSYTEWRNEIDRLSDTEIAAICQGTVDDWAKETFLITREVYNSSPREGKVSYDYIYKWTPVIEKQLAKGGIRLAFLLNTIFDPH